MIVSFFYLSGLSVLICSFVIVLKLFGLTGAVAYSLAILMFYLAMNSGDFILSVYLGFSFDLSSLVCLFL